MCDVPEAAVRAAWKAFVAHDPRMDPTSVAAWRVALEAAAPLMQCRDCCGACSKKDYPCAEHENYCAICVEWLHSAYGSLTETENGWVHAECYTREVVGRQAASKEG